MALASLPSDVIFHLIKTLDAPGAALNLSLTCRSLHSLALDDSLWARLFRAQWEVNEITLRRKQNQTRTWYRLYAERERAVVNMHVATRHINQMDNESWNNAWLPNGARWFPWLMKVIRAAVVFRNIVTEHIERPEGRHSKEAHNVRWLRNTRATETTYAAIAILMAKFKRDCQVPKERGVIVCIIQAALPMIYTLVSSMCLSQGNPPSPVADTENCPEQRKFIQYLGTPSIRKNLIGQRTLNFRLFRFSFWRWDDRRHLKKLRCGVADLHPYLLHFAFLLLAREIFPHNPPECYPFSRLITQPYLTDVSLDNCVGRKENYINSILQPGVETRWIGVFMKIAFEQRHWHSNEGNELFSKTAVFTFERGKNEKRPIEGVGIQCVASYGEICIHVDMLQEPRPVRLWGYITPWGIVGWWRDTPDGHNPQEYGRAWLYPE
jgi:hypothetical protein